MERVNFVSHTKQADDGTPVIVLDSFEENDSYFFNHYLKELDLPHLIVRKPELVTNELRLGKKFDTLIPDIGTGRLKEQILNTGSVRILRGEGSKNECGSNKSDKGLNEKFLRWVGFIGDKQPDEIMGTSDKPHVFIIEKYELKDGFSPDGILLDIFVNDYRDSEKAARLIQDESFRPEMLRSYFYDPDPEKIAGASNALYAACGEDEECRDTAIEKTFSLAVIDLGVNTGHNSSGM